MQEVNCILMHRHDRILGGCYQRNCKCGAYFACYGRDGVWYCFDCWMTEIWGIKTVSDPTDEPLPLRGKTKFAMILDDAMGWDQNVSTTAIGENNVQAPAQISSSIGSDAGAKI